MSMKFTQEMHQFITFQTTSSFLPNKIKNYDLLHEPSYSIMSVHNRVGGEFGR